MIGVNWKNTKFSTTKNAENAKGRIGQAKFCFVLFAFLVVKRFAFLLVSTENTDKRGTANEKCLTNA
jgi:hypothetical protein